VKPKFSPTDGFQRAVKARIEQYFDLTGQSPRDCPRMYLKSALILAWFVASYVLLVFAVHTWWLSVPLALSLGLAMAAIGFNIQHDGGHRAFSRFNWVNRLAAMTLDLLGGSSYIWDVKHNSVHHTYANITHQDDDINVGFLGRLSPHQKRYAFHRLQHVYLWFLYGFITLKWQLLDDFWNVARGKVGEHKFARPRGFDLAVFVGGKVVFFSLAFVIPMLLHPWWAVLLAYGLASFVQGVLLSTVFQLAHVVEEAEFPMPDPVSNRMPTHWAVHQVLTTVDFSRRNPVLTWLLGGLNFQIEHHLFPRVCHVHYPAVAAIVEKACAEFGLRYNAHKSFWAGVVSHTRWLRRLGTSSPAAT
jgi:linoleoyl-CoA desaturase